MRFERCLDASREEVWAAMTEPEQLRCWLAEVTIEPSAGGRIEYRWTDREVSEGSVRIFQPPSTLEVIWSERGHDTILRFELASRGDATLLVLDHRELPPESAVGVGAGWPGHLDLLARHLAGECVGWRDADFDRMQPRYEQLAAAL